MQKISTRQKMVEAALRLFHEKGIHATSVDAVLERSGTGKSQFAHYFKNKDGLILAALDYFREQMLKGAYSPFPSIETWKQLEIFMRGFTKWQANVDYELSCPIGTISHDLGGSCPEARKLAHEIFEWRRNYVAAFFNKEQASGRMKKNIKPKALADFCYTIIQGGLWMAKAERNAEPFENALNSALIYLKSLRKTKT
ncbi:MAG TPA: TetR/AcrR family transcriptional regulator [Candidatus Omnitrophota bacterium]|nr:TetR/AcrR family transcriptional regulator [Candidatus Omnitrophota bacterium]